MGSSVCLSLSNDHYFKEISHPGTVHVQQVPSEDAFWCQRKIRVQYSVHPTPSPLQQIEVIFATI